MPTHRGAWPTAAPALVGVATKPAAGWYAAGRDGAGHHGRLRAGTVLIARGEFSVVIIGLAGPAQDRLGALVTTYVMLLAVCGPLLTRCVPTRPAASRLAPVAGPPTGPGDRHPQ